MSSTRGKSSPTRVAGDAYYTPDAVAAACVGVLDIAPGSRILEPSVGGGAWVRAIRATGHPSPIVGVDVNPDAPGLALCTGFHVCNFTEVVGSYEWVIGNPPFNDAEAHVRHALGLSSNGVAMLLRLAFLESVTRRPFWSAFPADRIYVLTPRPSFTSDGHSDSCAYGFFVWRRGLTDTRLRHLSWRD